MNDEFQQLTIKRRKWVEANQENGFDEGIKRLLTDLYPDNAHFIYELLQNAEDAGASSVKFILNDEGLEFSHDGSRLFSIKDVESITSIGNSTKRDDPTSIGKFGVGFKAVFAYTNTPQVRSGNFAFRIDHLVIPMLDPLEAEKNHRTTHFVFPFNNPNKSPTKARDEIESVLRSLGDNSLLFLNDIRHIQYTLTGQRHGLLFLEEGAEGEVRVNHRSPIEDTQSHWLRFEKEVNVLDDDGQSKSCRIAIAYRLIEEEQKKTEGTRWKVAPVENGQGSIYFPAEKETSNLRFHLHAPFASTVARDSVRDCRANDQLRDHLAKLTAESLSAIRDKGLLTVGFLGVLPNPSDSLPEFYEPVRKAVVEAFRNHDLAPTKSGQHAAAITLYRGPARISEVLDDGDLALLTASQPPLWVANPSQQNQREDRFLESLGVKSWGWTELLKRISDIESDKDRKVIEGWLKAKSDSWLLRFYGLMGEACGVGQNRSIKVHNMLRIVRCLGPDNEVQHCHPRHSYFPELGGSQTPKDVPIVSPKVYCEGGTDAQMKSARYFLDLIGVCIYDAKARIEKRLRECERANVVVNDQHYKDLEMFAEYFRCNPQDQSLFHAIPLFLDANQVLSRPQDLCIDNPYMETGLSSCTKIHERRLISSEYKNVWKDAEIEMVIDFMVGIGVKIKLDIIPAWIYNNEAWHKGLGIDGVKMSPSYGVEEDYTIDKINDYLNNITIQSARLIWECIVKAKPEATKARFRPNSNYTVREADSQLVCKLKESAWIPDLQGDFHKPKDITKDTLYDGFAYDDANGFLRSIGLGERSIKESQLYQGKNQKARELGFKSYEEAQETARILEENNLSYKDIKALLGARRCIEQPESSVFNPERRRRGVQERHENAPTRESISRERKIQPGLGPALA